MDLTYRFVNLLGRLLLRVLRVRTHREGAEHLPTAGPVIVAATHVGYADFLVLERVALSRGRFVRFLCRHDAWRRGPVAWALVRMRHVPVDRAAPAAAYLRARSLLREGEIVGIFPEAGIGHGFDVRALMPGVAALARDTGAPVVPVAVWGTQRIWTVGPRDARGRGPGPQRGRGYRVDVLVGEPLPPPVDGDLTAWTVALGVRLNEMLTALQQRPEHVPAPDEHAPRHPAHLGGHAPDREAARLIDTVPRTAVRWWAPDEASPR